MGMSFFKQLRREFAGYNGKKLSQDLMAGLTVAAVALPLALAFGVPPALRRPAVWSRRSLRVS